MERNQSRVARPFVQYRNLLSKQDKYKQKSESIIGLMLRAWDRVPPLLQLGEWKAGDQILVNNQYIGRLDAFAIVNNNQYGWVEVSVGQQVLHFGIKLNDIRRINHE